MSQVVTLPAATRVFLPMTREAEEREPGNKVVLCFAAISHRSGSPQSTCGSPSLPQWARNVPLWVMIGRFRFILFNSFL